eukprot:TRINITY_DN33303_c0_g1_i1.p1 TRINITY_DN33303_c0_g1~~TRINITY_DN33303_c0_g1_i1.p1  ORF type:complete len:343 (-),score=76.25 TRINITY_DN33303_c0_g1_i1:77-1105(-)
MTYSSGSVPTLSSRSTRCNGGQPCGIQLRTSTTIVLSLATAVLACSCVHRAFIFAGPATGLRGAGLSKGLRHDALTVTATAVADGDSSRLPCERYVTMNRFRVKEGAEETKFEKKWGASDPALLELQGLRWFSLLRRVPGTPKSAGALSVVYNYDDDTYEDDYSYVSFSIWDKKADFEAVREAIGKDASAGKGSVDFASKVVNGFRTTSGPSKPCEWEGMLLEQATLQDDSAAANSKVFVVMNRFSVKQGSEQEFEHRWATRESKLQEQAGFQFFQLLRCDHTPDDDVNYISMSAWDDREAFDSWWSSKSFSNMAQVQGALLEREIVRYFYEGKLLQCMHNV